MRKKIYVLAMAVTVLTAGCSKQGTETTKDDVTTNNGNVATEETTSDSNAQTEGIGYGYGGELKVKVTMEKDKIVDLELVSNNETNVVIDRAWPVIKERIMEAQSPIVDSVSGATFSSYGVKTAVAEVLRANGQDIEAITFTTQGPETEKKELETVETQVVVVGGGPAGLSAAIEAKQNGVENVIVIEKLDILSGNGKFDLDFVDLINSKAQKENGIEDTVEDFVKYLKETKKAWDSDERILAQAEGSYKLDEWLREQGTELNYNFDTRNHMSEWDRYAGEQIQENMEKKAKELGIDIRTGTKGLDLIMEDGKAVGVKVQQKNNFYDIKAEAVIVATGGFCSNKELLAKYAPGTETLQTSNQMGTTGDFIPVFEKYNLALDRMDVTRIFPIINVARRDLTGGGDGYLFVNKEGKRFIDETKREMELASAIQSQTDGKIYYIYDQKLYDKTYRLQKHNKLGYHTKGETLEDLAQKLGIDAENLKETVKTYNQAVKGEIPDPFRETPFTETFNEEGPFYGVQVESAIHMTRGGVVANEKAQVMTNDGEIVEGLFAAGEVTATSQAYSAAVIFGRIAGEEAAKLVLK
ncbi:MAG: FAD-binding protein [Clostridiales bacterium]|nr:FAD-binding protein [Clostridiales bacterium]